MEKILLNESDYNLIMEALETLHRLYANQICGNLFSKAFDEKTENKLDSINKIMERMTTGKYDDVDF